MSRNAYIVFKSGVKGPEIQGVFSSKVRAARACRVWNDQVLIVRLNRELPRRRTNTACTWWHPKTNQVFVRGRWRRA